MMCMRNMTVIPRQQAWFVFWLCAFAMSPGQAMERIFEIEAVASRPSVEYAQVVERIRERQLKLTNLTVEYGCERNYTPPDEPGKPNLDKRSIVIKGIRKQSERFYLFHGN